MNARTILTGLMLLPLLIAVPAQAQTTAPYVSQWGDYRTVIPVGWKVTYDSEGTAFTEAHFTSYDPHSSLLIRWYGRYAVHKLSSGQVIMYSSAADYVNQKSSQYHYLGSSLIVDLHEITVGDMKAQQLKGKTEEGIQEWTVIPAPSGIYVAAYFAPENGFAKYQYLYDQMVASFALIKDGPGGNPIPGAAPPAEAPGAVETASPQQILDQYLADFRELQSKIGSDFAGKWGHPDEQKYHFALEVKGSQLIATWVYDDKELAMDYGKEQPFFTATLNGRAFSGMVSFPRFQGSSVSGTIDETNQKIEWTVSQSGAKDTLVRLEPSETEKNALNLRKNIIQLASTMNPAPLIPDEAQRALVQGNVFMKAATGANEFRLAADQYQAAANIAPWWGNAYNNLAIALSSAGQPDMAKQAMELYLLTHPRDSDQAQAKIYELDAQQQLEEQRKQREAAEIKAKYGDRRGSGRGFGIDDLFRYGAVVQAMSFDASGNQRTISLKIETPKENGSLQNYLMITDITSPSDPFGRKFSMEWTGTQTFYLDDRTQPNNEPLTLTVTSIGDDARISIRPASNASASLETNLTDLLRERARQAIYAGDESQIGNRKFYVLAQGGAVGSLAYFPEEIKDKVDHGAARDLMPLFVANVSYRGSDGQNHQFSNVDLGMLDGTPYHLESNGNYWEVKPGPGEQH